MPSTTDSSPEDDSHQSAEFERIEWDTIHSRNRLLTTERIVFLAGLCVLLGVYLYDRFLTGIYLIGTWNVSPADWLFLLSTVILVSFGIVPILSHRRTVRRILRRLRHRPIVLLSGCYLLFVLLFGLLWPLFLEPLRFNPGLSHQPPVGFTTRSGAVTQCIGEYTEGEGIVRHCHGTWEYPLGTDHRGYDMISVFAAGARVVLYVTVVTIALVIPIATAVGSAAGYYGGWIDAILMTLVDMQMSVPGLIIYLVLVILYGSSLFLFLLVFGLLSWGSVAKAVRSETLQRRESGFVTAARASGIRQRTIVRRHILPNVTNTVVPAVAHLIALLIIMEAGIAFFGFFDMNVYSWGRTIAAGIVYDGETITPFDFWWVSTFPAIALGMTVLAFKLFGDGLRDVLDPRGEQ